MNTKLLLIITLIASISISCSSDDPTVSYPIELIPLGDSAASGDDPSLLFAQDSYYYLMFLSDRAGALGSNNELWVSRSKDGNMWSTPVQVTQNTDHDWYPTLRQTVDGKFHLIWHRVDPVNFQSHIYYLHSTDGLNWNPALEVAITSGVTDDNSPSFIQTSGGDFFVYFHSSVRSINGVKDLFYIRSQDQGSTWSAPALITALSSATEYETFAFAAERAAGDLIMIFQRSATGDLAHSSSDTFFSTSVDGMTWSGPTQVSFDSTDSQHDVFPNVFYNYRTEEWTLSWTSTSMSIASNGEGGVVHFPVSKVGQAQFPTNAVDQLSNLGIYGWSTRVQTDPGVGIPLMIWVNRSSGHPQLWKKFIP